MSYKPSLRTISLIVVLAFTVTSIGTVPFGDSPYYAQDLLSPQSRFNSVADAKQALQQRADELSEKINFRLKQLRLDGTTPEIEDHLITTIREVLDFEFYRSESSRPLQQHRIELIRGKHTDFGRILAQQGKNYEVVALLRFEGGAAFVIAYSFKEGKAGVFPYELPPSSPASPVLVRQSGRALSTATILLGLGAFAAALAYPATALVSGLPAFSVAGAWPEGTGINETLAKTGIFIIFAVTAYVFISGIYNWIKGSNKKEKIERIWAEAVQKFEDSGDISPIKEAFKEIARRRDLGGEDGEPGDRFNESYKIIESHDCVSLYIKALANIIISKKEDHQLRERAIVALNRIALHAIEIRERRADPEGLERYISLVDIREGLSRALPELEGAFIKEEDVMRKPMLTRLIGEVKLALGYPAPARKTVEPQALDASEKLPSTARQSGRTRGELLGYGVIGAMTYGLINWHGSISVPISLVALGVIVIAWILLGRRSPSSSLRSFLPFVLVAPSLFGCAAPQVIQQPAEVDSETALINRLIVTLQNKGVDMDVRSEAAVALGEMGSKAASAVTALLGIVTNTEESGHMRMVSAAALGRIGPAAASAESALIEIALRDEHMGVRILSARSLKRISPDVADRAVTAFIKGLNHLDADVRKNAASALRKMGTRAARAIPVLEMIAEYDPIESVKEAAARTIREIQAAQQRKPDAPSQGDEQGMRLIVDPEHQVALGAFVGATDILFEEAPLRSALRFETPVPVSASRQPSHAQGAARRSP